jgi:choline kinase
MKYIILAAGKGVRLNPLTLLYPKCLFELGNGYSILQRMIDQILLYDKEAEIITVIGFMADTIKQKICKTKFVYNPFYNITNSIASLWFAKEYLCDDNITIINGDIVLNSGLTKDVLVKRFDFPLVLLDATIKKDGDYNVQVQNDNVVIMSKDLQNYYGEYVGVVKINKDSVGLFKEEVEKTIAEGYYDQWYENVFNQLIFNNNFELKFKDVSSYDWTEIDCVDDLIKAKNIFYNDNK